MQLTSPLSQETSARHCPHPQEAQSLSWRQSPDTHPGPLRSFFSVTRTVKDSERDRLWGLRWEVRACLGLMTLELGPDRRVRRTLCPVVSRSKAPGARTLRQTRQKACGDVAAHSNVLPPFMRHRGCTDTHLCTLEVFSPSIGSWDCSCWREESQKQGSETDSIFPEPARKALRDV